MIQMIEFVARCVVVSFLVLLVAFSIIRYTLQQYYLHKAKYTQEMIATASSSGHNGVMFQNVQ